MSSSGDARAGGAPLVAFVEDMRRLRAECDWKRGQTHRSLARHLLEEAHETIEVLDGWDDNSDPAHLCEELGDLLLQVYFHAAIAEEEGQFTIDDVARGLIAKMRRRNPHVFGEVGQRPVHGDAAAVNDAWQAIKAREQRRDEVTDGLPPTLPALLLADKVLDRLERAGTPVGPVRLPAAGDPAHAVGERLLAVVADARTAGVDPEQALRDAVRRRTSGAADGSAPIGAPPGLG